MSTYKNLMTVCCAAVLALGLAACGGGGSDSSGPTASAPSRPAPPPEPALKTSLSYATDLNTAVAALTTLSGDATDDGSALMMAMEASGKIGVVASGGNSKAAMMSAQTVLDARKMLMDAVEAATDAKTAAMEEKAKLSATDDADVIAALDNAITAADRQIEAAHIARRSV